MPQKKGVTLTMVEDRKSLAIRLVLALGFVYIFGSLAIDTGSYWHYLFTFISIGISVNAAGRLAKDVIRSYGRNAK